MYNKLKTEFKKIIEENCLMNSRIKVMSRVLSKEEAIGKPEHDDYPLLKGKENLMESEFCGSKGAAYSDMCGNFSGTLKDVIELKLDNNYRRAVFVSSINAVLKHLGLINKTEHCRNEGPVNCADHLTYFLKENYPGHTVLLIGFQPRFVEVLTENFKTNIIDLNPDNIAKKVNGVEVLPEEHTDRMIEESDLIFVTSSTFVNGTAPKFAVTDKPNIFYGVTGAGPTYLLNLERYCYQ
ncbi:MAG: hypothetical protein K9M56_08640 [Victivallales bacterium]|nr:hypothetical protein [Victivallales bacterium]